MHPSVIFSSMIILSSLTVRAEAACQTATYAKKDETDARLGRRNQMDNTVTKYIMKGFLAVSQQGKLTEDAQSVAIPCASLNSEADVVLNANGLSDGTALTSVQWEKAWVQFLLEGFGRLNYEKALPASHDELVTVTGYKSWPMEVVKESLVKQKTRVIYRSPAGVKPRMHISETHDDRKGDPASPIRETEVAMQRPDGDWDFFVYGKNGLPDQYSEFPSGHKVVPSICMGCHYNLQTRSMDRIFDLN